MPPQPLSRVHPNPGVRIATGVTPHTPDMARCAFAVINLWAQCDNAYARILSSLMKADPVTGTAMYLALASGEAKKAVLFAAARHALSEDLYNLLRAVITATKASRNQRNDFAHHLWGNSPGLPSTVLLVHPTILATFLAAKDAWNGREPEPQLDRSKVMVYRLADFQEAEQAACDAHLWTARLAKALSGGLEADLKRFQLLQIPQIERAFQRYSSENAR